MTTTTITSTAPYATDQGSALLRADDNGVGSSNYYYWALSGGYTSVNSFSSDTYRYRVGQNGSGDWLVWQPFLIFDTRDIPTTATITSATLRVYGESLSTQVAGNVIRAYPLNESHANIDYTTDPPYSPNGTSGGNAQGAWVASDDRYWPGTDVISDYTNVAYIAQDSWNDSGWNTFTSDTSLITLIQNRNNTNSGWTGVWMASDYMKDLTSVPTTEIVYFQNESDANPPELIVEYYTSSGMLGCNF